MTVGGRIAVLLLAVGLATTAHAGCGADDTEPCTVAKGTYHALLPEASASGPEAMPAVVFLHGYGASGAATLRMRGMVQTFLRSGYAVIAPDGQVASADGKRRSWSVIPDMGGQRDEVSFILDVADDAATRFDLDRSRMMLAGFSLGGSMTTYVACREPQAFAVFAPVAGSFWNPLPERCTGPVRLFHTHGTADRTVPMKGRRIRPGLEQGDVLDSLAILAMADRCAQDPETLPPQGRFARSRWTGCADGAGIDLALHPGQHGVPEAWAPMVLDWVAQD